MGYVKTAFLMGSIIFLFTLIGHWLGGEAGMFLALFLAVATNFGAYWFSDQFLLKMYSAKKIDQSSSPEIYQIVKELVKVANLPLPAIYIIKEDSPNAFATGRNPEHAAVAVTTGLIKILNLSELRGVIAHEIAHIANRDMLISTFSATLASAISSIATFSMFFGGRSSQGRSIHPLITIVFAILAPIAATLIQMAISRAREFEADRIGSFYSKDPLSLASALKKN
jgi:heat shock protein HtpX